MWATRLPLDNLRTGSIHVASWVVAQTSFVVSVLGVGKNSIEITFNIFTSLVEANLASASAWMFSNGEISWTLAFLYFDSRPLAISGYAYMAMPFA